MHSILVIFIIFVVGLGNAAFLAEQLPLNVTLLPTDSALLANTPLTLIFTRSVVALGADVGSQHAYTITCTEHKRKLSSCDESSIPQNPFKITLEGVGQVTGFVRWVTTYIARFDPLSDWSPDLRFSVSLDPTFRSYDGSPFPEFVARSFSTPYLTGEVSKVESESANSLTDNLWTGINLETYYSTAPSHYECPPDAKLTISFSSSVDIELVTEAFVIRFEKGTGGLASGVIDLSEIHVEQCEVATPECIQVSPTQLHNGVKYELVLPEGTIYHDTAGPLRGDIIFLLSGLLPFQFDFDDIVSPSYVRYDVWLRHGLSSETSIEDLEGAISLVDMDNEHELDISLELVNKATLRLKADVLPETSYTLTFAREEDGEIIKDGFDLPLENQTLSFTTQALQNYLVHADGHFVFQDFPPVWTVFGQGGKGEMFVQQVEIMEVTQQNWELIVPVLQKYRRSEAQGIIGDQIEVFSSAKQPETPEFRKLELPLPNADGESIDGQQERITNSIFLVTRQFWTDGEIHNIISITDLAVSAVQESKGDILIWVTRMSTGEVVAGADVALHSSHDGLHKEGEGTTDEDGIVIIHSDHTSDQLHYVFVQYESEASVLPRVQLPTKPYRNDPDLSIILDRAVYEPGDTILLKAYLRDCHSTPGLFIPDLEELGFTAVLEISWQHDSWWVGGYGRYVSDAFSVDVEWTEDFGSYFTEIEVPHNATLGTKSVTMRITDELGIIQSYTTVDIVIANPRRPTGTLSLSTEALIYRLVHNETQTDPGIPLVVDVKTETGSPVKNAEVDIQWTVLIPVDSPLLWAPISVSDLSTANTSGSFTVTTNSDGKYEEDFVIQDREILEADKTISFVASWIDPTGALIKSSLDIPVSHSELSISVSPTFTEPLPGMEFGFYVSVQDFEGEEILGHDVGIEIYEKEFDESDDIVATRMIEQCNATSDGGDEAQCFVTLSAATEYELMGVLVDSTGMEVHSPLQTMGLSPKEWEQNPLSSIDLVNFRLNQKIYELGDSVVVSFYNPFANCKLLMRWGNVEQTKHRIEEVSHGLNTFTFEVGNECVGDCNLLMLLSIPAQTSPISSVEFPTSKLFDILMPQSVFESLLIEVIDTDTSIDINLEIVEEEDFLPGTRASFTLDLTSSFTEESVSGEIAVFVVDKAYLDLKPYPLKIIGDELVQDSPESFTVDDSRIFLSLSSAYEETIETFERRRLEDPWVIPSWTVGPSNYGIAEVDESDEDFWDMRVTRLTRFPAPQNYNFDYYKYGRYTEMAYGTSAMYYDAAPQAESDDGEGGTSVPPADHDTDIRSRFETVPLFVGRHLIDVTNGKSQFDIDLPDNIGKYVIRVYAVDDHSRFGSTESEITVSKPISLEASNPRFVRDGDVSEVGVSIAVNSPHGVHLTEDVSLNCQFRRETTAELGLIVHDGMSKTLQIDSLMPQAVHFPVDFWGIGVVDLTCEATSQLGSDGLMSQINIELPAEQIYIKTSMTVQGAAEEDLVWSEGIEFPETIYSQRLKNGAPIHSSDPFSSLNITAGIGKFVEIQSVIELLTSGRFHEDAEYWLAVVVAQSISEEYGTLPGDLQENLESLYITALEELHSLTSDDLGLSWAQHSSYVNGELNALAIHVAQSTNKIPPEMVDTWTQALVRSMLKSRSRTSFESILSWLLVLYGPNWSYQPAAENIIDPFVQGLGIERFGVSYLVGNFDNLDLRTKCKLSLAYLLHQEQNRFADLVMGDIMDAVRIRGITAYVSGEGGYALSSETQIFALEVISRISDTQIPQQLANYVSQVGIQSCQFCSLSNRNAALLLISLAHYDRISGNTRPYLHFSVISVEDTDAQSTSQAGLKVIAEKSFASPTQTLKVSKKWSELQFSDSPKDDATPSDLFFIAKGVGQVSVSVGLEYIPPISGSPIYRGIFVERSIRRMDLSLSQSSGPNLILIERGAVVEVTIQMTTPDELENVVVEDFIAAGLEPLDPNLYILDDTSPLFSEDLKWFVEFTAFSAPEISPDYVKWTASRVLPGTHSVSFQALAVTPGVYIHPPAKVYSTSDEQNMGLSSSGKFLVSQEPIPENEIKSYLALHGVTPLRDITPVLCGEDCGPGVCDLLTGKCISEQKIRLSADDYGPEIGWGSKGSPGSGSVSLLTLFLILGFVIALFICVLVVITRRKKRIRANFESTVDSQDFSHERELNSNVELIPGMKGRTYESVRLDEHDLDDDQLQIGV